MFPGGFSAGFCFMLCLAQLIAKTIPVIKLTNGML